MNSIVFAPLIRPPMPCANCPNSLAEDRLHACLCLSLCMSCLYTGLPLLGGSCSPSLILVSSILQILVGIVVAANADPVVVVGGGTTVSQWMAVHFLSLLLPLAILFVPKLLYCLMLLIVLWSLLATSYLVLVWLPLPCC